VLSDVEETVDWSAFDAGFHDTEIAETVEIAITHHVAPVISGFTCSECHTGLFVEIVNEFEVICKKCGEQLEYLIDSAAEFRWYGSSEDRSPDPSRIGNPKDELYPESSLSTRLMMRPGENKQMRRIRQYHTWNIMPYKERSLHVNTESIKLIGNRAGIPIAILNEAIHLFAQVSPLEIQRGVAKESLMAGCLYESLKRHGTPWRPVDIANIFKIDIKHVTKGVKKFSELLDEHLHVMGPTHFAMPDKKAELPASHFRHCLEPAIYKLETPRSMVDNILEVATSIGNSIETYGMCSESNPSSLAATALSVACQHLAIPKTNDEVSRVCGISAATLQKNLKKLTAPWRAKLIAEINMPL
jgi:transcription initiation factor TFIIIB Brf1 subunit/transcription initiation factor TFIIB